MSVSNLDNNEKAKLLTNGVVNDIQEQIENQTIAVNNKKMNVNPIIQKQEGHQKIKRHHKTQHHQPTIDELNQIKQAKMMEIRQIQKQEDLLKKSAVLNKSKVSKSCVRLWKSDFTQQEMNEIKAIKKKQRQYERQLKKKEKNLQSWLQEKRLEDEQLNKRYIAEQCQQRKKQLVKQRQQLQKKKKQRQALLEEQIKKIKERKTKKLLHHQMVESWKKYQQASEAEQSRALALERQRRRVHSKQIQQHQAKYLQLKKDQQKKREKALEESRSAKLHLPYIHSQIFYKVQKEEEQKFKLERMKIQEIENNILKKKEYSKLVTNQLFPKLRQHSASNSKEKSREKSANKTMLTGQQSNKLGNNYMRTIHQKITNENIIKEKNSLKILEQPGGNSIFYKNYLRDLKTQNQKQNNAKPHDLVDQTMKNNKLSEADKLHKVRMILDKDTGVKRSDSDMVETLKNKIKVLNEIMH